MLESIFNIATGSWYATLVNNVKALRQWCVSLDFVKSFKIQFYGTPLGSGFHVLDNIKRKLKYQYSCFQVLNFTFTVPATWL